MRRALCITILSAALVLSLAACSSNGNTEANHSSQQQSGTGAEGGDEPSEAAESYDPLGKYEQPITVTEVLSYRPPEEADALKGITPETNGYVKDLKEMLNIDLKYLWSVPTDQFEQKFSLAIASGDLPDVMQVDYNTFEKFKEQDMLADLSGVYPKYASSTLRKTIEADGGFALKSLTSDGKLLGLATSGEGVVQIVWIRSDWLKNLNLQPPATMDELETVAEAFVNNDPDQDGKADTYGISLNKNFLVGAWGFDARGAFYSYGSYPGAWIKGEDGRLAAGEIQPSTKAALARLQSWYKKGIIDKEFALKDENKASEDLVAGKVGISFGEWWYPNWPLNLNKDNDPKAEWIPLPLPSLDGKPGKTLISKSIGSIMVVNKKAEHPEAAIKMANFFQELSKPKYAVKDSPDFKGAKNGYIYLWFQPRFYYPKMFDEVMAAVSDAVDAKKETLDLADDFPGAGEAQSVFANAKKFFADPKDNSAWGMWFSRGARDGGVGLSKKIVDEKVTVYNEFYGPPTPTMIERGSSLNKLMAETFTKIIMGSAPVSEFDRFAESWKKLGGGDITEEVNDWYEKNAVKS
ncbi:extracellular solute-binding protein [Paenibacillus prosopidis]|uniref:Putative aldouronate transport system substrate-binding protein n=1 Tax=Paenibacillus prosopidis TaxID=630520 RepID=A0A368W2I7_9BACL|nr:extracellular solute-binding protein [Paenibacillus prosopidis]RCW49016.1 putative aldouronate transport system substrate-binding protein [Paenibacillus prosopidis]